MRYVIESLWTDGFHVCDYHSIDIRETEETLVFFIPNDCGGGYRITVIKQ